MSGIARILDVAPLWSSGIGPRDGGHYTLYHDDLRRAAGRAGLHLITLVPISEPASDGVSPCLRGTDPASIVASLAERTEPGDVVLVYEGSLELLEALHPLAHTSPGATFVVNLFRPEPGLDGLRSREPWQLRPLPNLIVSAETEQRVPLARALGITCTFVWRLHTQLFDAEPPGPGRSTADGLRVLIPLSARGYSAGVSADIAYVVTRLARVMPAGSIRWTVTGAESTKPTTLVRGARISRLGVGRIQGPDDRESYARLFADHDVVWMPQRSAYRTQSSGKTLDALALGRPVLAVRGTWPAMQAARWTGHDISYHGAEEAAATISWLAEHVGELNDRLAEHRELIRSTHSPDASLRAVTDAVQGSKVPEERATSRSAPRAPLAALPADPLGRALARLAAARTARARSH